MALSAQKLIDCQILYAENVTALRDTIALKYPNASSKERADLLSKSIKQILHTNLASFEAPVRMALIQDLLKTAVQKKDFAITAQDVMTSYTTLNDRSAEMALDALSSWLQVETGQTASIEEIHTLLQDITAPPLSKALSTSNVFAQAEAAPTPNTSPKAIHTLDIKPPSSHSSTQGLSESPTSTMAQQTISGQTISEQIVSEKSMPSTKTFPYKKYVLFGGALGIAVSSAILVTVLQPKDTTSPVVLAETSMPLEKAPLTFLVPEEDYLMAHLQYKVIDEAALNEWLIKRGSMLAEEPYFSTILNAAASYNINPLLMFAITGQEQGFVPKSHKRAAEIANNPFNVYGSWQDFNTNIEDTAFIAARTIINLSKGCPPDADPIQFLNKKYAEDPKWHLGVTALLKQLEEVAG